MSPKGTVALIKADRKGYNNVKNNDANYRRRKCNELESKT